MVNTRVIWDRSSNDGAYLQHRIPGIVVTKKNTVIIYCEARTPIQGNCAEGMDWCLMDVYMQRSTDHGESFGEPIFLARGAEETPCVNNPVMIVGNDGVLHFLFCKNYSLFGGGLWYRRSYDDGLTWSEAREVTDSARAAADFDCFAFGPTHGICTSEGVLMVPVWYVPKGAGASITSHNPSRTAVFYSTDNGESWQMSGPAAQNSNETAIVELSNGEIFLNSRSTPYRTRTVGKPTLDGWTESVSDPSLPDPDCCGGMVAVSLPNRPRVILFTNCASIADREHVTVRCSYDDGKTFSRSVPITGEGFGGYSDIAVDRDGRVFVLYEEAYGKRMHLASFDFDKAFGEN